MNEITFAILKIVVSVCAALVTVYVVPYLKTLRTDRRYAAMIDMIEIAVRAAEQQITGSGQGAVKKERVEEFVADWLAREGVEITRAQLSELIESCVYELKAEQKGQGNT